MKKVGNQTYMLDNPVTILETASIVGKKEADGPLAKYFDICLEDEFYGEKTWEKAEAKMIKTAINNVIRKANLSISDIDYLLAGDLLNQCISSSFGVRDFEIPFMRNLWCLFNFCRRTRNWFYAFRWWSWKLRCYGYI